MTNANSNENLMPAYIRGIVNDPKNVFRRAAFADAFGETMSPATADFLRGAHPGKVTDAVRDDLRRIFGSPAFFLKKSDFDPRLDKMYGAFHDPIHPGGILTQDTFNLPPSLNQQVLDLIFPEKINYLSKRLSKFREFVKRENLDFDAFEKLRWQYSTFQSIPEKKLLSEYMALTEKFMQLFLTDVLRRVEAALKSDSPDYEKLHTEISHTTMRCRIYMEKAQYDQADPQLRRLKVDLLNRAVDQWRAMKKQDPKRAALRQSIEKIRTAAPFIDLVENNKLRLRIMET
jgi:hypothetical protein